jgi:hypothetical protein
VVVTSAWPAVSYEEWSATRDTHLTALLSQRAGHLTGATINIDGGTSF